MFREIFTEKVKERGVSPSWTNQDEYATGVRDAKSVEDKKSIVLAMISKWASKRNKDKYTAQAQNLNDADKLDALAYNLALSNMRTFGSSGSTRAKD